MAEQSHKSERAIWMLCIEQSTIMNAAELRYLDEGDRDVEAIEDRIRTSAIDIRPEDLPPWIDRIERLDRRRSR